MSSNLNSLSIRAGRNLKVTCQAFYLTGEESDDQKGGWIVAEPELEPSLSTARTDTFWFPAVLNGEHLYLLTISLFLIEMSFYASYWQVVTPKCTIHRVVGNRGSLHM